MHSYLEKFKDVAPVYNTFQIEKRNSKKLRTINAPSWQLKAAQKYLLKVIRTRTVVSCAAHGFVPKRCCDTAINYVHKNAKYMVKCDLHDAFGSVTFTMFRDAVQGVFPFKVWDSEDWDTFRRIAFIWNKSNENYVLPQGSPLSPTLLNLVLYRFDYKLLNECDKLRIKYVRYADDLILTSKHSIKFEKVVTLIKKYLPTGLTLSAQKCKLINASYSKLVLGQQICSDGKVTIPKKKKEMLKLISHKLDVGEYVSDEDTRYWRYYLAYATKINPTQFRNPRYDALRYYRE